MRCEHPHWYRRSVISEGCPTHPIAVPETIAVEHDECGRCGAWLSLGPSNDEPEAVRIEIATAGLVAGYLTNNDTDVSLDDPIAKEVLDWQLEESDPLSPAAVQCDALYCVVVDHHDRDDAGLAALPKARLA